MEAGVRDTYVPQHMGGGKDNFWVSVLSFYRVKFWGSDSDNMLAWLVPGHAEAAGSAQSRHLPS